MIALVAGIRQPGGVGQVFQPIYCLGKSVPLILRQKAARVGVEFRAQLCRSHRILGGATIVFFHFFKGPPILEDYLYRSLKTAWAWIIRVDAIAHAAGEFEDLRILETLGAI